MSAKLVRPGLQNYFDIFTEEAEDIRYNIRFQSLDVSLGCNLSNVNPNNYISIIGLGIENTYLGQYSNNNLIYSSAIYIGLTPASCLRVLDMLFNEDNGVVDLMDPTVHKHLKEIDLKWIEEKAEYANLTAIEKDLITSERFSELLQLLPSDDNADSEEENPQ